MSDMDQGDIIHVINASGKTNNQVDMGVLLHSDVSEQVHLQTQDPEVVSYQRSEYEFRVGEHILDEIVTQFNNKVRKTFGEDVQAAQKSISQEMIKEFLTEWAESNDIRAASDKAARRLPDSMAQYTGEFADLLVQVIPQQMERRV